MFDYKFLKQEHLDGFDNYKYSAVDTSPLSVYVMHPFWNKLVEYIPKWVAPNLLTFVGFLFTVADFLLLTYYDYDFDASSSVIPALNSTVDNGFTLANRAVPRWCWITMSLFLFLAYTLDGIDGKQARRTGTSGPLGELFDHGLDSYSVFFIPICLYSIFGRYDYSVSPLRMYFILWNVLFSFYISHWEKYNTGVLFLPWGYDMSMWTGVGVFMLTGLFGHEIYKVTTVFGLTAANLFEVVIYTTGFLTNLPISAYNMYLADKNGTGKMLTLREAFRPLVSILFSFLITTYWILCSPTNIIDRDPRVVFLLIGTLFSNFTCPLIVSQMSSTRCPLTCISEWVCLVFALLAVRSPLYELVALYTCTVAVLSIHIHYGVCVVRQMCRHFKIKCFRVKVASD